MAAAIVSFINLRRLGQRQKASLILALSVPACFLLFYALFSLPDEVAKYLPNSLVPALTGLIYAWFQNKDFDVWESTHPGIPPANGWTTVGWGLLGLVAVLLIAGVTAVSFMLSEKVENVNVYFSGPTKFAPGEEFDFQVQVENTAEEPRRLKSIGLPSSLLEDFDVARTDPPFLESSVTPLGRLRGFVFDKAIPPKGRLAVQFHARGRKAENLSLSAWICIDTYFNCGDFRARPSAENSPQQ
jgi:hypothetical protein